MAIYESIRGVRGFKRFDGEIGLEIETETKRAYEIPELSFWDVKEDGSLRDFGREYVLKSPLKIKGELPAALEEFEQKTSGIKFIKDSITTSVHVHMNVLNESFKTLGNFLTAYVLVENILIRFSGDDRRSNLFCLPVCDAEDIHKNIVGFFKSAASRNYVGMFLSENSCKYGALNLSSFGNFGSIEFRSFRGTTDRKEIQTWVDVLYAILEYARKVPNPRCILEDYQIKGVKLLDDVFNPELRAVLKHKDDEDLIERNVWYAARIASCVKTWDDLDNIPENKPKYSHKQVREASTRIFGKSPDQCSAGELEALFSHLYEVNGIAKKSKSASAPDIDWLSYPGALPVESDA